MLLVLTNKCVEARADPSKMYYVILIHCIIEKYINHFVVKDVDNFNMHEYMSLVKKRNKTSEKFFFFFFEGAYDVKKHSSCTQKKHLMRNGF